ESRIVYINPQRVLFESKLMYQSASHQATKTLTFSIKWKAILSIQKSASPSRHPQAQADSLRPTHKKTEIRIKAINARNGMVINPNQLIYWPLQGTPWEQPATSAHPGIFCCA